MKTDDLIRAIAADADASLAPVTGRLGLLAGLAVAAAALGYWLLLGPRGDLLVSLDQPRFLLKLLVVLLLAATAFGLSQRWLHPGIAAGWWRYAIFSGPAVLVLGVAVELMLLPPARWEEAMIGDNARVCLTYIPLIGLAPLGLMLLAFRQGAPADPAMAGALAGLIAGAIAATFYATHCPDDSPLFVALWYSIAIAALCALGALFGSRLLRW